MKLQCTCACGDRKQRLYYFHNFFMKLAGNKIKLNPTAIVTLYCNYLQ